MTKPIISLLLIASLSAFAQTESNLTKTVLDKELKPLNTKIENLSKENTSLKSKVSSIEGKLDSTNKELQKVQLLVVSNHDSIIHQTEDLDSKITSTSIDANTKIDNVDKSLSTNSLYGIIGVLSAILLSGLLYWLLSKRQKTDKTDLIEQLSNTKSTIEESLVKEFGKQTGLMDAQLQLIELQKSNTPNSANVEPDHSLALKLASEINLIERNLRLMDDKTKGLKQLSNSVRKLKDNLAANGYEIPELLGKSFNAGMKVIVASSIPDENLAKDEEIITKVLIPQVNYNEKMIQTAQIETSKGY